MPFAACAAGRGTSQDGVSEATDAGAEMSPDAALGSDADETSASYTAGSMPLRHLTSREYRNSVKALVDDSSLAEDDVPSEATSTTFDYFPFRQPTVVGTVEAGALQLAAEQVARNVAVDIERILPCSAPNSSGEDDCATRFITTFGKRAYRRPLDSGEVSRLEDLYRLGRTTLSLDFRGAIVLLVEAILQSPAFYYLGPYDADPGATVAAEEVAALDPHTLASRMSYFLWGAPPDTTLVDAAENGQLASEDGVEVEARRMLDDAKARDTVEDFVEDLLDLETLPTRPKDLQVYPTYQQDAVAEAMRQETRSFAERVVFDGTATFSELMTSNQTMVNRPLAELYGVSGVTGDDFVPATFDSSERGGLFTLAAFLANTGGPVGSAPPRRGKFVYTRLLCKELPPPPQLPPGPAAEAGLTTRQRFERHSADPCATSCHSLIDDLGFAFEHYDGIGGYRETDMDMPVDAGGSVVLSDANEVQFADANELSRLLAADATAQKCFTTQWLRYALHRREEDGDHASLDAANAAFSESGGDIRELIVALVKSPTFRYRTVSATEGQP